MSQRQTCPANPADLPSRRFVKLAPYRDAPRWLRRRGWRWLQSHESLNGPTQHFGFLPVLGKRPDVVPLYVSHDLSRLTGESV
jgi:hypothetical protein